MYKVVGPSLMRLVNPLGVALDVLPSLGVRLVGLSFAQIEGGDSLPERDRIIVQFPVDEFVIGGHRGGTYAFRRNKVLKPCRN